MKNSLYLCIAKSGEVNSDLTLIKWIWSLRLSVRTEDFHSSKRSSILLGTTKAVITILETGARRVW